MPALHPGAPKCGPVPSVASRVRPCSPCPTFPCRASLRARMHGLPPSEATPGAGRPARSVLPGLLYQVPVCDAGCSLLGIHALFSGGGVLKLSYRTAAARETLPSGDPFKTLPQPLALIRLSQRKNIRKMFFSPRQIVCFYV